MKKYLFAYLLAFFLVPIQLTAEDGSRLWLRYEPFSEQQILLYGHLNSITKDESDSTLAIAVQELQTAWQGFTSRRLSTSSSVTNGSIVVGSKNSKLIKSLSENIAYGDLGKEGYFIQTINRAGKKYLVVTGETTQSVLYGVFHLLRLLQTGESIDNIQIKEVPRYDIRILNHWDNLDRTVERGYAGRSLWMWDDLPDKLSPRYKDYARANASIGINATVLNNVNASPQILTAEYLTKVKALADVFRPYGIKVYLSVNFSSPAVLGALPNSDPFNKDVVDWWTEKVKEVYSLIPDFGGFLVKANSEGLPGPQDYGRTHADGANMLADALKPFGGIVMWRAFVYNPTNEDRAKQAYQEFVPLDGQFRDNVIIQIKNGPIDFQPREPFSPLFGSLTKTQMMAEFQITQEYLGFSNHLVYLSPLFKECLDSDTYSDGKGSAISLLTDASDRNRPLNAIAAVANIGEDINWCGHHFAQANWYAFGRLAWNHTLSSDHIANEWLKMTFVADPNFVEPIKEVMLTSREAAVNYMMPLGLHHIFAFGHHYGPEPWCDVAGARPDWMSWYYHKADSLGIGFDRTVTGSNAVVQYHAPLRDVYADLNLCPDELLLWFHHVSWDYRMRNNLTLWDNLCIKYDYGVNQVRTYQKTWNKIQPYIDASRYADVQYKLKIQARDAVWWKDACLLYFQTFSGMPIPDYIEAPVHDLKELKQIKLNMAHHN